MGVALGPLYHACTYTSSSLRKALVSRNVVTLVTIVHERSFFRHTLHPSRRVHLMTVVFWMCIGGDLLFI